MFFKDDDKIKVKSNSIATIISEGTTIEGNVVSENSIRLSGAVKGDIVSKGLVIIGAGARVKGNITAESVLIAGSVEGDLNIVNKTNIEPTGEVRGDLVTKRLLVDEESVFSGKCTMKRDPAEPAPAEGDDKTKEAPASEENKDTPPKETKEEQDEKEQEAADIEIVNVDELRKGKSGKKKR